MGHLKGHSQDHLEEVIQKGSFGGVIRGVIQKGIYY